MAVEAWQADAGQAKRILDKEDQLAWALGHPDPDIKALGLDLKTQSLVAGDRVVGHDPRVTGLFPEGFATTSILRVKRESLEGDQASR